MHMLLPFEHTKLLPGDIIQPASAYTPSWLMYQLHSHQMCCHSAALCGHTSANRSNWQRWGVCYHISLDNYTHQQKQTMNNITKHARLESFPNTTCEDYQATYVHGRIESFLRLTWNPFANTLTIDALTDCFTHYQGAYIQGLSDHKSVTKNLYSFTCMQEAEEKPLKVSCCVYQIKQDC